MGVIAQELEGAPPIRLSVEDNEKMAREIANYRAGRGVAPGAVAWRTHVNGLTDAQTITLARRFLSRLVTD